VVFKVSVEPRKVPKKVVRSSDAIRVVTRITVYGPVATGRAMCEGRVASNGEIPIPPRAPNGTTAVLPLPC
jgi:hypothetical protein